MKRHSAEVEGYVNNQLQLALPNSNNSMDVVEDKVLKRARGRDLAVVEYETPALKRHKEPNRKRGREDEGNNYARKHLRFTYIEDDEL